MNESNTPFQKLKEFEMMGESVSPIKRTLDYRRYNSAVKKTLSESVLPNDLQMNMIESITKNSISKPMKNTEVLKDEISDFYKSKSLGPMLSFQSWMNSPKIIDLKKFYQHLKEHSFSNTDSLEVLQQKFQIFCILLSKDGSTLAVACENNIIYLWDMKTFKIKAQLKEHTSKVVSMASTPLDNILLSCSYDKSIILWDFLTGDKLYVLSKQHTEPVFSMDISSNGLYLATGGEDKFIIIWNLKNRESLKKLEGHTSTISCLSFSKKDKKLISASWDTSIRIWDVESGIQDGLIGDQIDMIRAMIISPDENMLFSAGADKVCFKIKLNLFLIFSLSEFGT